MKKLNDLLVERSTLVGKMSAILSRAQSENRARTAEETTEWNGYNEKVTNLSTEIETLERQLALDQMIASQSDPETEALKKRYNVAKAIRQASQGSLDGLEREMHQEGEKEIRHLSGVVGNLFIPSMLIKRANEETKTTGLAGGHLPLGVAPASFSVAKPLYMELGCKVYENLGAGKIDIPFSKGSAVALVSEESATGQNVPTKTKGTLSAARYHAWQKYTQEYLAETAVLDSLIGDWISAVDRGIGSAAINAAVAANVMSGFGTGDTAAALDWAGLLAILGAIDHSDMVSENLVMSKQLFYKLAGTPKVSGDARMILEGSRGGLRGDVFGIPSFGTPFLPVQASTKYGIVYGDWNQVYIGTWGGVQLLIDPFTSSDNGYVKVTFGRMASVAANPYALASKRNVSV